MRSSNSAQASADGSQLCRKLSVKRGRLQVAVLQRAAAATASVAEHSADLSKPGVVWVAYPKGNQSDVNRDSLWPIVAEFGMRPDPRRPWAAGYTDPAGCATGDRPALRRIHVPAMNGYARGP